MNITKKLNLSIILLSLSFFLMIDTKYHQALGDYILEFLGFKSWTSTYGGFHLTILFFGIIFLISLYYVKKYNHKIKYMTSMKVFIIFLLIVTSLTLISNYTAWEIKKNSKGLESIAYVSERNQLEYRSVKNDITFFNAYFTLKNYSDEMRTFQISIDSYWARKDNILPIEIYKLDDTKAVFKLEGEEEKTFQINLTDYKIYGGKRFETGGYKGSISELVLSNTNETIHLKEDDFFNLKIKE